MVGERAARVARQRSSIAGAWPSQATITGSIERPASSSRRSRRASGTSPMPSTGRLQGPQHAEQGLRARLDVAAPWRRDRRSGPRTAGPGSAGLRVQSATSSPGLNRSPGSGGCPGGGSAPSRDGCSARSPARRPPSPAGGSRAASSRSPRRRQERRSPHAVEIGAQEGRGDPALPVERPPFQRRAAPPAATTPAAASSNSLHIGRVLERAQHAGDVPEGRALEAPLGQRTATARPRSRGSRSRGRCRAPGPDDSRHGCGCARPRACGDAGGGNVRGSAPPRREHRLGGGARPRSGSAGRRWREQPEVLLRQRAHGIDRATAGRAPRTAPARSSLPCGPRRGPCAARPCARRAAATVGT